MSETERIVFNFIDRCYDGTHPIALATLFIQSLSELEAITEVEKYRFNDYDMTKFNQFVKEVENSL